MEKTFVMWSLRISLKTLMLGDMFTIVNINNKLIRNLSKTNLFFRESFLAGILQNDIKNGACQDWNHSVSGIQATWEFCLFFSMERAMPIEARQLTQWDETSWVCGTREWWGLWQIGGQLPSSSWSTVTSQQRLRNVSVMLPELQVYRGRLRAPDFLMWKLLTFKTWQLIQKLKT